MRCLENNASSQQSKIGWRLRNATDLQKEICVKCILKYSESVF